MSVTCTEPLEDATVLYQSLIGGEHGGVGIALLSSDGHEWHGAKLLLGNVRGRVPSHHRWAQIIILREDGNVKLQL